jgi:hypothetical protein
MKMGFKQRGMTLIGWCVTMAGVGLVALVFIRALPLYMEDQKVSMAISSIQSQAKTSMITTPEELRTALIKRLFYIDDVQNFKEKDIKIKREVGKFRINIEYEARTLLFYNIYLLIAFKHDEFIQSNSGG